MAINLEEQLPGIKNNTTLASNKIIDFSGATSVALPAATTIAGTTAAGATTVTSTSANALTVGRQGATAPVLNIDASTASVVTGLNIKGAATGNGVALLALDSGSNTSLTIDSKGSGTIDLNVVSGTGNVRSSVPVVITSASANALAVGLAGSTNPSFVVDSSTGSQAAGLKVTGATSAGNVAVAVISSGSDANLLVNAKGTGTIGIGSVSTGAVTVTPATTFSGLVTHSVGTLETAQAALVPNNDSGAASTILVGTRGVSVTTVANDANDWIVLPAIASCPIGHQIRISCNAGGNFELRTPAASNTKINDIDADGSQEYLCTDTDLVIVTKHTTSSWVAQSLTKLGAVRTAVIPD